MPRSDKVPTKRELEREARRVYAVEWAKPKVIEWNHKLWPQPRYECEVEIVMQREDVDTECYCAASVSARSRGDARRALMAALRALPDAGK